MKKFYFVSTILVFCFVSQSLCAQQGFFKLGISTNRPLLTVGMRDVNSNGGFGLGAAGDYFLNDRLSLSAYVGIVIMYLDHRAEPGMIGMGGAQVIVGSLGATIHTPMARNLTLRNGLQFGYYESHIFPGNYYLESPPEWGFTFETGLDYELSKRWSIVINTTFNTVLWGGRDPIPLNYTLPIEGYSIPSYHYINLGIGASYSFKIGTSQRNQP